MKGKTIIYVAYSPYENQGKILDFILESYQNVFAFTIGHHNLGGNNRTNKLTIYRSGKVIKESYLYHIPIGNKLVFSILPFRSILNLIQIFYQSLKIRLNYGQVDVYFSVNGYAAWMGLVLESFGLVKKTVYWICDYYPIRNENKIVYLVRWIYWQFEKMAARSDVLAFHNNRLVKVWRDGGLLPYLKTYPLVPIATNRSKTNKRRNLKKIKLAFLGVLKRSQGLDYIFDSAELLNKSFPGIQVEVLGAGPDMDYFKKRAKDTDLKTKFYGYVSEKKIDEVLLSNTIGVAPYMPDPASVSFYGDPGKIKRYISLGLPVIATNIHEFPKQLEKHEAGCLVKYGDVSGLVLSIKKIVKKYSTYSENASRLNDRFYYKKIYPKMFEV